MENEYIYIIQMGNTSYYKIGKAKDIEQRLKSLQTGNPLPLTCVTSFKTTKKYVREFEQIFHTELAYCKCCGEWFNFNHNEIQDLIMLSLQNASYWTDFDFIVVKTRLEYIANRTIKIALHNKKTTTNNKTLLSFLFKKK